MTEGDRIQLESAGGGGFGDPRQRPRELVAEDVRQGFVSPEMARQLYDYDVRDEEMRNGGVARNDAEWYEERMVHCATCGRMIAKRYLAETS